MLIGASVAVSTGGVVGRYLYRLESLLLSGDVEDRVGIFEELVEGEYLLSGQDSVSGCWSSKTVVRVEHRSNLLDISIDELRADTVCVAGDGTGYVTFTVDVVDVVEQLWRGVS